VGILQLFFQMSQGFCATADLQGKQMAWNKVVPEKC
jgi:hypothetical protein